ncbi:MAG: hypothetical protein KQI35_18650 [Bacteroidetes bacterium]|nr:hypothetical protein [Bacteroidota bacterium]
MKTKITLFTVLLVTFSLSAYCNVWRVNNRPNVDADFSSFSSAHNAAASGDTIYLEGSPTSYGLIGFYKKLVVFGTGYWLDENDSTQAYQNTSKITGIGFFNGSSGSVVEGLEFEYTYVNSVVGANIYVGNITIQRNRFILHSNNGTATGVAVQGALNNIIIRQNYIKCTAGITGNARGVLATDYLPNCEIKNNFLEVGIDNSAVLITETNEAASLILSNNVIWGDLETSYSSHYNNILLEGNYTPGTGDINSNNLCNATQYPNINGNQQNVDMSTVFEDYTSYIDNGYILAAGSPAIGAGVGGNDCGVFGTGEPYVLSGMPPIPAIFEVEMTQSIGTSTLPVTIKAKSHN